MVELLYALGVFRTDASAQDKWDIAVVRLYDAPVELLPASSDALASCVEKQHVGMSFILAPSLDVSLAADAQSLDNLQSRVNVGVDASSQVVNHDAALVAVQLNIVEVIVIDTRDNRLRHLVDEHSHALWLLARRFFGNPSASLVQPFLAVVGDDACACRNHLYESWTFRIEYKSYHVNA